ncbi:hypothetical protein ONZ51_g8385 [Trametes cubensis]|uniref:Uncharacterized protein n=1 Tax=Trametes cubensis TaxID=1111947 RepID=A0AAD7X6L0_9APHY|nr:hypothetical protein ONZ51_g8385 [Trametes cubensis]
MPRPDAILSGLRTLLDGLSGLSEVFFQANAQQINSVLRFEGEGLVDIIKLGFTAGAFSNIPYEITINHPSLVSKKLTVYVRNPSAVNPATNRKAMANALEYLLVTDDTIVSRDVDARKF